MQRFPWSAMSIARISPCLSRLIMRAANTFPGALTPTLIHSQAMTTWLLYADNFAAKCCFRTSMSRIVSVGLQWTKRSKLRFRCSLQEYLILKMVTRTINPRWEEVFPTSSRLDSFQLHAMISKFQHYTCTSLNPKFKRLKRRLNDLALIESESFKYNLFIHI